MRNKKSNIIVLIIISVSIILNGCKNMELKNSHYDFPSNYDEIKENLVFKTKIDLPTQFGEKPLKSSIAQLQRPDAEKIINTLFADIQIVERSQLNMKDNYNNQIVQYDLLGEGGEGLNMGNTTWFWTPFSVYIDNVFRFRNNPNIEKYTKNVNLEFISQEDALEDIKEKLRMMGYDLGDFEYQCYVLDYNTLQKEEDLEDYNQMDNKNNYKVSWTKADECYYFCIRQITQGLTVYYPFIDSFKNSEDENAPIQILYSKNGIEKLIMDKVYTFLEEDEFIDLKSFKEIAARVEYRFTRLITSTKFQVISAKLYFGAKHLKKETWEMTPVWVFKVLEVRENDASTNKLEIFVDAVTGKELPMEDKN